MGKVRLFLLAISLGLLTLFNGCGFPDSHRLDETLYYFKNETASVVYEKSFTKLNAGHTSFGVMYEPNREAVRSGGGHFSIDSVIIRKTIISNSVLITTDSIIYRNPKFGDDINQGNHFFNPKRWLQLEDTKFVYAVQEADFD